MTIRVKRAEKGKQCLDSVRAAFGRRAVRGLAVYAQNIRRVIVGKACACDGVFVMHELCRRFFRQERFGEVADHIHAFARFQRGKRRVCNRERQCEMQNTIFCINNGEIRVGRETLVGHFRDFVVVLDTFPTALLVASDNQFELAAGRDA